MKSKDKQRKDQPKRPSSTPIQALESPRRKLNRKNIATPEAGREEESPSYAEITKMKYPDHPVQIDPADETTLIEPERLRSRLESLKNDDPDNWLGRYPMLQVFTDDEDAAPYDHYALFGEEYVPPDRDSEDVSADSELSD